MLFLPLFVQFVSFFLTAKAACSWTVDGVIFTLTSVQGVSYSYTDGTFVYFYSPCVNSVSCTLANGTKYDVMCDQYNPSRHICTAFLAEYDASVFPYFNVTDVSWNFNFDDGLTSSTCPKRYLKITWRCGTSSKAIKAGETSSCYYYFILETPLACNVTFPSGSSSSSSSSLSGGWVFIIILSVLIVVYCVGGYVFNGYKHPENGWGNVRENVPNLSFWSLVPKWTWAGCCVTKEFIIVLIDKARNRTSGTTSEGVSE